MQAPIAEVKKHLCEIVDQVERGETVVILRHGRPAAQISPIAGHSKPWRVAKAPDPSVYKGVNINEPILDEI